MPTLAELKQRASDLELKGYSRLKKPELEELIYKEERRREDIRLAEIRSGKAAKKPDTSYVFNPSEPFHPFDKSESPVVIEPVKGKGITNLDRLKNYTRDGRKRLTAGQARRIRKNWNAGDWTVDTACNFPGVKVAWLVKELSA